MNFVENKLKTVDIFTDGACSGNPGIGGWGALLRYGSTEKELSGALETTTNNRMEMSAVVAALSALKFSCRVNLFSDSRYVIDGITKWVTGWQQNGWRTADKKPVQNSDLWQEIVRLSQNHTIEWHWVKGHAGHAENERVDLLARTALENLRTQLAENKSI